MRGEKKTFVYIGNWRPKEPGQSGYCIYQYDENTARLTYLKSAINDGLSIGAAYLNPKTNILYCANEQTHLPGRWGGGGQILAVKLDPESGDMTEISRQPSYGVDPTYIALDHSGKYMIVTHHVNYAPVTKIGRDPYGKFHIYTEFDDTTTVLFPLREDGSVGEPCDVWKHTGHGPIMSTQANPHVHSVMSAPDGGLFAACDKGSDRIYFFRIDYGTERLVLINDYPSLPGSSPRHSCFHPTLPYWYMNNETMPVLRGFRYSEDGRLDHICTVNSIPDGYADDPSLDKISRPRQSDIQIHPSGKYIYTLFRGINCISVFAVDQDTGVPERMQTVWPDGKDLRTCAFSPDGRYMLVTAPENSTVIALSVGPDGKLTPTGISISQPRPGVVTFFKPK